MRCCLLALALVVVPARARADDPPPTVPAEPAPVESAPAVPAPETYQPIAPPTPAPVPTVTALPTEPVPEDHKVAAAATMAGMYTAFAGWMYLAWYRQHKPLSQYKWGGDDEPCAHTLSRCGLLGWAGDTTYAGGEDKFGHAWSTMSLARLGTEMLSQWGGYDRDRSMLVATGLAELLFVGVEVRDGFFFEFSFSDLGGDTVGALAALALMHWPRLDEMFDFRVQYWPSSAYLKKLDG
ncbi:MAG TPA: DUF2279 domain-containing protein, partial [Kofleriaceae bacterium]|nr:DUF2279 domain-containing protein [Kofleriaceae bacterium]